MNGRPGAATLRRIAVVDGGEIALGLIRAIREYRLEHARDLQVVAIAVDASADNLWVREADEAVLFDGQGWADAAAVEHALRTATVDVMWDGAGSLDDRPMVAEACQRLGIRRVGAVPRSATGTSTAPHSPVGERLVAAHAVVDGSGTTWIVGLTEGTTLIESAMLDPELDQTLRDEARRVLDENGGAGACSVMFSVDDDGAWSCTGVRPGLGRGHEVVETTSGVDLVKLQLLIADGGMLSESPPSGTGCAVAVSLHAEDAETHVPLTDGRIALLRLPGGPGVRVDRSVAEKDMLSADGRGEIAKLTAWGRDRDAAIVCLTRALAETVVGSSISCAQGWRPPSHRTRLLRCWSRQSTGTTRR